MPDTDLHPPTGGYFIGPPNRPRSMMLIPVSVSILYFIFASCVLYEYLKNDASRTFGESSQICTPV